MTSRKKLKFICPNDRKEWQEYDMENLPGRVSSDTDENLRIIPNYTSVDKYYRENPTYTTPGLIYSDSQGKFYMRYKTLGQPCYLNNAPEEVCDIYGTDLEPGTTPCTEEIYRRRRGAVTAATLVPEGIERKLISPRSNDIQLSFLQQQIKDLQKELLPIERSYFNKKEEIKKALEQYEQLLATLA